MLKALIGVFIVLHGLVHLWYVTLSQRLVEFQPAMGWTGESWLVSGVLGNAATRSLASVLYVLAAIAFVASGVGVFMGADWWRPVLIGTAVFSSAALLLYWDGNTQMLVEKGMLGLLINILILVVLLLR